MAKKPAKPSFDDLAAVALGRPVEPEQDQPDYDVDPTLEEDDDQTITIQEYTPRTPPGAISMADSLEELEAEIPSSPASSVSPASPPVTYPPEDAMRHTSSQSPTPGLDGEILPPQARRQVGEIRYESRIRVLEAFQYPGTVTHAPAWIDRNWVGWGDWDPVRNIEAGPALRVPTARGDTAVARPGDYVVKQEVILARGIPADIQIEVWNKDQFERNFIPDIPSTPSDASRAEDSSAKSSPGQTPETEAA